MKWIYLGIVATGTALMHPCMGNEPYRVGVYLVGESASAVGDARGKLEKNIQQWLENDLAIGVRAHSMGALEKETATIEELLLRATGSSSDLRTIADFHPLFQRLKATEAFAAAGQGQSISREVIDGILALHPEGLLAENVLPARLKLKKANLEQGAFLKDLRATESSMTHACQVDLDLVPAEGLVWIDGFSFGIKRHFELLRGQTYQVVVQAQGFVTREFAFDCRHAGQWYESIHLERGKTWDERALRALRWVAKKQALDSFLLVRFEVERVELFFYTPGVGIDPISTRETLRVPEALSSINGLMDRGAFLALLDKHRFAPLGPHVPLKLGSDTVQSLPERVNPLSRPWLEKKGFWVLAGVVGVGVVTAVILRSGSGSAPKTQPSAGISGKWID